MKITNAQALRLRQGLAALDGYEVEAGGKVITQFYKLGAVRLTVAKNINLIDAVCNVFREASQKLVTELSDDKGRVPPAKMKEYTEAETKMLATENEVELFPIRLADLKIDENPIPASALAMLEPVLDAG